MKNETLKKEAFRAILKVIQKLPQDYKGCEEIGAIFEELAERTTIIFDPIDFTGRATKNLVYKGLEIFAYLTDANRSLMKRNYY